VIAPDLVWGLFTRLLGVVYLVALVPLWWQIVPFAGDRGCLPLGPVLDGARRDFPWHARLRYFPTLFWISTSPFALRGVLAVGCAAAVAVVYGGAWSPLALLVCYVALLSAHVAVHLVYPWDRLLLEAGFLAVLLPALRPLPELSAVDAPLPLLAFAFHLLLVRVMVGFGKYKFIGHTRRDDLYTREFLVNMTPPTRLGWYAHHLPAPFHRLGVYAMAVAELLLPPLALIPGPVRLVPFASTTALMAAIWLTGNYGYFNLIVLVLCVPLLDLGTSLLQLRPEQLVGSVGAFATHIALLVLLVGALLHFPFNSWCAATWLHWPALLGVRNRALRGLLAFYRGLLPFGLVHPYGVFPANSVPALRFVPVLEGSLDGLEWREYGYRFWPSTEASRPPRIAPVHPRLDHLLLYEGLGISAASGFLSSSIGVGLPYGFSGGSWLARVMRGLTQADSPILSLLGRDPFEGTPPRLVRTSLYVLEPLSPAEHRATGLWWRRRRLGIHMPPLESEEAARLDAPVPGPELFHWDDLIWRRRAPMIRRFERAAIAAGSLAELDAAVAAALEIPAETVQRFWEELIPSVLYPGAEGWLGMADRARETRRHFGAAAMLDFERIAAMLAIGVAARIEGRVRLPWPVVSYFHVGMLLYALIAHGRREYESAFGDDDYLVLQARRLSDGAGMWLFGIFRPEALAYEARAARLVEQFAPLRWSPLLPGFALVSRFLSHHFRDEEGERNLPLSRRVRDGAWETAWAEEAPTGSAAAP
jgi:hypothetical protein